MANKQPLFSALEICLLQQGLHKIVFECDQHISAVVTLPAPLITGDNNLPSLVESYNRRKAECWQLSNKLTDVQFTACVTSKRKAIG